MACGLNVSTLTCTATQPSLSSCKSLCQRISWHLLLRKSHDVQAAFYTVIFMSKMPKIALGHLTAGTQMLPWCVYPSSVGDRPIRCHNQCPSKNEWLLHRRTVWISPLLAPNISLLIKASIWTPLYPGGSHWSSICNQPWVKLCKVQHIRHTGHLRITLPFELSVWIEYTVWLRNTSKLWITSGLYHVNMHCQY